MSERAETIDRETTGAEMCARPLVSVIVTFYNQAAFVEPTLSSVLAQDYSPMEVIVVDDGSTDDTPQACAAFSGRVRYVRRSNGGPSAARNEGLRQARGSLIAHLDGDDLWDPGKITAQVATALRYPEAGMIVVDGEMFCDGETLRPSLFGGWISSRLADESHGAVVVECHEPFVRACLVTTPSQVMFRREALERVGTWKESVWLTGDHELYLRITLRYPVAFVRRSLIRYRYGESTLSGPQALRAFRWGLERVVMLRLHRHDIPGHRCEAAADQVGRTVADLTRDAYHRSPTSGRRWAAAFLCRLAWQSRRPDRVFPYLVALAVPEGVQRLAARAMRARFLAPSTAREAGDREGTRLR
jgi:glycosyltransferase involved in cell wall biosynthesis